MTHRYVHRSGPFSIHIRETSSCSIWRITQKHTLDSVQRMRDPETFNPKWDVFIKALPSGPSSLCGRGDRKVVRVGSDEWLHGNSVFQTQQNCCIYELTEMWQLAQGLHRFKADGVLALRWGSGHWLPTLTRSCDWHTHWQRENLSPALKSHCVYQPHSRTGPILRSGQHKKEWNVFCFILPWFRLTGLLPVCFDFHFVYLWFLSVCFLFCFCFLYLKERGT